ncbi:transposase family protein [Nonomuraea roseola]|uniref:Transposase family protein n=1 Tax=Nonomuraea roseola TaxID=46179 RepID=A0ABV5PVF7_9ACTN
MPSARVHSRYRRTLRDLAVCGRPLTIELEVRRFFCGGSACERVIFAEQVEGLTGRHAPSPGGGEDSPRPPLTPARTGHRDRERVLQR